MPYSQQIVYCWIKIFILLLMNCFECEELGILNKIKSLWLLFIYLVYYTVYQAIKTDKDKTLKW